MRRRRTHRRCDRTRSQTKHTTPEAVRAAYEAGTSLRSFVSAQDIANMAVFLSSDQAKMAETRISVDGHTENLIQSLLDRFNETEVHREN